MPAAHSSLFIRDGQMQMLSLCIQRTDQRNHLKLAIQMLSALLAGETQRDVGQATDAARDKDRPQTVLLLILTQCGKELFAWQQAQGQKASAGEGDNGLRHSVLS